MEVGMKGFRPGSALWMAVMGGNKNRATLGVTTTGAATLTIAALTVSAATTVDWGDGSSNVYTGAGARTHNYAGAGTYNFTITPATNVTALTLNDNKITLNSGNIKAMVNMVTFIVNNLKGGTFNSVDISAWRPTYFWISDFLSLTGVFNSSDISAWRPSSFYLYNMPSAFSGTFNSSDVSAWRPTGFGLLNLPSFLGTFDTSNASAWNPTLFWLGIMPTATFTILANAGALSGWIAATTVRFDGNALSAAKVNQILSDLWSAFATRTATAGTINIGGTNAAPSGTYQAANPPTTGKEFAYELLNDSQNVNPTKKWATVTFTA
jgi:hypothetical protein